MQVLAFLLGLLIALQGLLGIVMPDYFVEIVRFFQTSPTLYFAAVVRVGVGLVLLRAAKQARAAMLLRVLAAAIVVGGVLTPIFGIPFAQLILGWWSDGGATMVRLWALASFVLGVFIMYATKPPQVAT